MRLLLCCFFCFVTFQMVGQETFNYRLHFGFPACTFGSVISTDTCYYIAGRGIDSLPPYKNGLFFTKLNLEGSINSNTFYSDTIHTFESNKNTLMDTKNGRFLYSGSVFDTTDNLFLLEFSDTGEFSFIEKYQSPFSGTSIFISSISAKYNHVDTTVYLLGNVNSGGSKQRIIKTDLLGNVIWNKTYWLGAYSEGGGDMFFLNNGNLLLVGTRSNNNQVLTGFDYRARLYEINEEGDIIWTYLSSEDEFLLGATAVNEDVDGNIVFATYEGQEVTTNPSVSYTIGSIRFIKLDKETKEEIWRTSIRSPDGPVPIDAHYINHIIKSNEGDGYIAVGGMHQVNEAEGGWDQDGVIIKIAENGDSLWHRRLSVITSKGDWHQLKDVESTSDGGYIMVGEARYDYNPDILADPPRQGGWVIKVDGYGCLVPDCHLTSTYEPDAWQGRILLYPNPVKDYLNLFFQTEENARDMTFAIFNLQGQVVQQFQSTSNEVTMMVDVNHYPVGQYYLILERGGQVLWREGFVKVE